MKRIVILTLMSAFTLATSFGFLAQQASAAFNKNRLIDDAVFNNSSSLGIAQIDTFLNDRNSCISTNSGFSAPDPTGYSPSGGFQYGGNVSAGTVIAHSAQVYGLNPQVLLVTLQKEQSLVTSTSCSTNAISKAAGYGCPDSGGSYSYSGLNLYTRNGTTYTSVDGICVNSASKAGFTQQVIRATWLLKFSQERSLGHTDWAVIQGNWDNSDDLSACYTGYMTQGTFKRCPNGTATYFDGLATIDNEAVHMDTGATASLYRYTPHFHGNQNFVSLFESWFGSVLTPNYSWRVTSQYSFTDETKSTFRSLTNLAPNERVYVGFTVQNTGNATWSNSGPNATNVGTLRELGRNSPFFDDTWLGPNRPARMKEATVAPGQTATFEFWMKAPLNISGNIKEYFGLVQEGIAWYPDIGLYFDTNVQPANYSWRLTSQYARTDADPSSQSRGLNNLEPGERVYAGITVQNTGNLTWKNTGPNPVDLGISRPYDRYSPFFDSTWLGPNRPARIKEATVAPGQTATFEFWMKTPSNPTGTIYEYLNLVSEGASWMNDIGLNFYTTVVNPNLAWQPLSQYAYSDANKTNFIGLGNLSPGQTVLVGFTARNNGNFTWRNTGYYPIRVGTTRPNDRSSVFCHSSWLGCNRPVSMKEASVPPGFTATFEFLYKAPSTSGSRMDYFSLLAEGLGWMNDPGMNYQSTVH